MTDYLIGDIVVDGEGWLCKRIGGDDATYPWLRMIGPDQLDCVDAKSVKPEDMAQPLCLLWRTEER